MNKAIKDNIASTIQWLRKDRGLSQAKLAKEIGVSQPTISLIEEGKTSLSAEQLLFLIKRYNLDLCTFDIKTQKKPDEHERQLQNALIRYGALHLRVAETDSVLNPFDSIEDLIIHVLYHDQSARRLLSLCPVITKNIDQINFNTIRKSFNDKGLPTRYLWLLDNVLAAIQLRFENDNVNHKEKLELRKANRVITNELHFSEEVFLHSSAGQNYPDYVQKLEQYKSDNSCQLNWKEIKLSYFLDRVQGTSLDFIKSNHCPIANKWNILTTISVHDFYEALKRAYEDN